MWLRYQLGSLMSGGRVRVVSGLSRVWLMSGSMLTKPRLEKLRLRYVFRDVLLFKSRYMSEEKPGTR